MNVRFLFCCFLINVMLNIAHLTIFLVLIATCFLSNTKYGVKITAHFQWHYPQKSYSLKAKNVLYEDLFSINSFAQVNVGKARGVILNPFSLNV